MSGQWDPGGLKRGMVIDDIPVNGVSHEEKGFSSYQSVWERINPGRKRRHGRPLLGFFRGLDPWQMTTPGEPRSLSDMEAVCGWDREGLSWVYLSEGAQDLVLGVWPCSLFTFMHWRRKWQPTPVFLPGESQGRGSLVGGRLWGHRVGYDWSDSAAAAAAMSTVWPESPWVTVSCVNQASSSCYDMDSNLRTLNIGPYIFSTWSSIALPIWACTRYDSFHSIWEVSRQYLLWNKMRHQPYYTLLIREYIANKFNRWRVEYQCSQVYQHVTTLFGLYDSCWVTVLMVPWLHGQ